MMATNIRKTVACIAVLSVLVLTGTIPSIVLGQTAAQPARQGYATAEAAVTALIDALRADKLDGALAVLGPGSEKLLSSGDKYADAAGRQSFLAAYDEQHRLVAESPDRMILQVGKVDWPLPLPLVQANGRWNFDTNAGVQELVNRRIGANEVGAIRLALVYVDAQKAFFAASGEFAQRFLSSPGKHDGLYWPAAAGEPESPLASLAAQATEEGYPIDTTPGRPRQAYHGYYFRILTGQGTSTPEGAGSYIGDGRMTNGFALVAWPASYESSGIMSFIINQNGIVFQKDLGPKTAAIASAMKLYDPDLSWTQVDVVQ